MKNRLPEETVDKRTPDVDVRYTMMITAEVVLVPAIGASVGGY